MAAVQETVDRVRRIDVDQYRYGFETLIESDKAPRGLSEDTVRFISAKKNEPAWMLEWRVEAYPRWVDQATPEMGAGQLSQDRLPGSLLLLRAEEEGAGLARRGRSGNPENLRKTRHSPARSRDAGRRGAPRRRAAHRGRGGVRFGVGRDHLPERAEAGRRDLHADLRGDPRAS